MRHLLAFATLCVSLNVAHANTIDKGAVWGPMIKNLVTTHLIQPNKPKPIMMFSRTRLPQPEDAIELHRHETVLGRLHEGKIPFTVMKYSTPIALNAEEQEGEVVHQGFFRLSSKELCTMNLSKKKGAVSCQSVMAK